MTERGAPPERYLVERTLGRGGMATVFLARDRALDRLVAFKVLAGHLADDATFRERFLREARLAAKLVHPNVVHVYDVGEDERGLFIVMEYVEAVPSPTNFGSEVGFHPQRRLRSAFSFVRLWKPPTPNGSYTATSSRKMCFVGPTDR